MGFEILEEMHKQRKWYRAAEEIKRIVAQDKLSPEENNQLLSIAKNIIPNMHPISMSEVAVCLARTQETSMAVNILRSTLESIQSLCRGDSDYANERLMLRMEMSLYLMQMDDLEEREADIFEWRGLHDSDLRRDWQFSRENRNLLNKVGYVYYNKVGNIEMAQEYLLKYIKDSGDDADIEHLVELSLVSRRFFDFVSITSLEGFEEMKNGELRQLFLDFQQGVFSEIEKWEGALRGIVSRIAGEDRLAEYMMHVTDKIYLINIVSICFKATQKYVPLETLREELKVTNEEVVQLVLSLLGHGLVTGWLDTEKGILMLDKVVPKSLSKDDISAMKNKFVMWKERVQRAIDQASQ